MEKDHLEILLEDIRGKFDLVLEGHSSLHAEMQSMRREINEKIEHVDFKVGVLNKKIDGVENSLSAKIDSVEASLSEKIDAISADLSAHRADTEAHHGVYRVKEGGE
jgi:archaellum component FlaC